MLDQILNAIDTLGYIADTPGAYTRGALSGRLGERRSGREMLTDWGVTSANDESRWELGDILGALAEMVADPTNLVGAGVLGKTAKAAKVAKESNKASMAMRAAGAMPEEIAKLTKIVDESGNPKKMFVIRDRNDISGGLPNAFETKADAMDWVPDNRVTETTPSIAEINEASKLFRQIFKKKYGTTFRTQTPRDNPFRDLPYNVLPDNVTQSHERLRSMLDRLAKPTDEVENAVDQIQRRQLGYAVKKNEKGKMVKSVAEPVDMYVQEAFIDSRNPLSKWIEVNSLPEEIASRPDLRSFSDRGGPRKVKADDVMALGYKPQDIGVDSYVNNIMRSEPTVEFPYWHEGLMRGTKAMSGIAPSQIYAPMIAPELIDESNSIGVILKALAGYNTAMLPERAN